MTAAAGLVLALAAACLAVGPAPASAQVACPLTVGGGTDPERVVVRRVLCRMPGTRVTRVVILPAPSGITDALALGFVIRARPAADRRAQEARGAWEADVAAGAIRDALAKRGQRRAVAYGTSAGRLVNGPGFLRPLARPEWRLGNWTVRPGVRPLGRTRDGSWARLDAKLRRLAREFDASLRLQRHNPFGKAPAVTLMVADPAAFLRRDGVKRFRSALAFGGAQYDGALLALVAGGRTAFLTTATHRTARATACAVYLRTLDPGRTCPAS